MGLTREQWASVEALFLRLLELPAAVRMAELKAAAGDDTVVYERVAAMLAALNTDTGNNFMADPVQVSSTEQAHEAVAAGTRFGTWSILEPLGHGGMGEVYRAERADGTYQQQVAVKLLKRGLDTQALLDRFLRERRILAQLVHPNIAHLIDAGASPDGRPYLVMEYVAGKPITDWCRDNHAPLRRILELMCEVCEAVHAAHRRLVVHRDLKPSNVLVSDAGEAKLLDFGIAKLIGSDNDNDPTTQLGSAPVTPQYAAPEQILGQPVTTAADVYALGVLLYQLLAGRLPRDHASLASATVSATKGLATIVRPSAALREIAGATDPAEARARANAIEGDLDLIVLKCLQTDPERRYRSASELADDLHRFLEQRPIVARPDSLSYRVSRFVRRNRVAVAAGAAVLLVVIVGVAGIVWEADRAHHEAIRAEQQAARAGLIKNFVVSVFQQQDPLSAPGKDTLTPKQMIGASIVRANEELSGNADLHSEVLADLGEIEFNLGDIEGARATLQGVLEEQEKTFGPSSLQVAQTLRKLAPALRALGRHDEDRQDGERALAILQQLGAGQSLESARVRVQLASALSWGNGAPARSLELFDEADRIFQTQLGPDSPETITALQEHASTEEQGRHDAEAEKLLREVVARDEKRYGPQTPRLGNPLSTLGHIVEREDRPEEAEGLYRRAVDVLRPTLGPRNHTIAVTYESLGSLYAGTLGRFDDGERALKEGQAALPEGDNNIELGLLRELGRLHVMMGKADQAEAELRQVFESMRKMDGEGRAYTWYNGSEWGRALAAQGHLREAEAIQRQAAQKLGELMGPDSYQNSLIGDALADTLEKKGGANDEVLALRRRSLALAEKKYPRTNTLWAERATNLSRALLVQDSEASRREARPLLDQATSDFRASANIMDSVGQAFLLRGQLDAAEGQREQARADLGEALQRLQQQPVAAPEDVAKAQALLRRLDKA